MNLNPALIEVARILLEFEIERNARIKETAANGETREDDPKATADTNQPLIRANRPAHSTRKHRAGQAEVSP